MAADETCGLGARPELWMDAGRALPSPGVQRDPVGALEPVVAAGGLRLFEAAKVL